MAEVTLIDKPTLAVSITLACVIVWILAVEIRDKFITTRELFRFRYMMRRARRNAWVVDVHETGLHCGACSNVGSFHIETEDKTPLDSIDAVTILDLLSRIDPKHRGSDFPPVWLGSDGLCFKPTGIAKRHAKIVIRAGDGRLH